MGFRLKRGLRCAFGLASSRHLAPPFSTADPLVPSPHAWSTDGRSLAFLSDKQVGHQPRLAHLWIWDRATGRAHCISVASIRSESLIWAHEGRRVLVWLPEHLPRTGAARAPAAAEATAA